ncbi:hypothetical protein OIU85_023690 [Salix viminalis]|uniref:Uncharacterized protein n=1 Tax=Salix viminalis TaxID=40686 RepID=A0A9Q0TZA1_SALVM|nr:hypothetical protein OIU85_023690 [Salix viminalis]
MNHYPISPEELKAFYGAQFSFPGDLILSSVQLGFPGLSSSHRTIPSARRYTINSTNKYNKREKEAVNGFLKRFESFLKSQEYAGRAEA